MPSAPPKHRPPGWQPRKAWSHGRDNVKPLGWRWTELRLRVFERDKYTCRACGLVTLHPECDHITPRADGGADTIDNLQCLCSACHKAKSVREAKAAQRARKNNPVGRW